MRRETFFALCTLFVWTSWSQAQGIVLVPCPGINFFGEACGERDDLSPAPAARVAAPPPPLFTKDTMAPDTPPLMLDLLNAPTADAAKRFVAWQAQRLRAIALAQRLIQEATRAQQPVQGTAP